jgi:cell division septum initiation protein DivIVA
MAEDVESLHREIDRLNRALGDQEARIAALEREATGFREIEAHLLRAISLANSEFRALVRAARSARIP